MNHLLRAAAVLLLVAATSAPVAAQAPPEPLAMGVPYYYQPGNIYWWRPAMPVPSPYPFGSSGPVFGRYSWDYGPSFGGPGYYSLNLPAYPYSFQYPTLPGRVWYGWGW